MNYGMYLYLAWSGSFVTTYVSWGSQKVRKSHVLWQQIGHIKSELAISSLKKWDYLIL